ncbi:class I SAM-dependent methyltransferase [Rhabdaerophilum calidifontis]|uniref:class I SAM-dependent methyltransferase n=1 Tax=Rhabdaerophilum calidifontis TaxID=2604328 RepID=UPI00123A65D5|nr:class I SAM-dependent methyltransferase [Rhabdaerophilum calidifontis]
MTRALAPSIECPCAGAHRTEAYAYDRPPMGETRFDLGATAYRRSYARCGLCGHWFGAHDLDLSALYAADYVDKTYGGSAGMAARFARILALPPERSDNAGRVARLSALADALLPPAMPRRLLDIGAGLGVFPAGMAAKGWAVLAVEPDPRTVVHLREVVGVEALEQPIEALSREEIGGFALVSFNKVLEHVEEPAAMLRHAGRLLLPGGLVYVEVPDGEAASGDPDGPAREEFFIEHHHVFSPASLAILVARAGFVLRRLEALREPSGKYTVWAVAETREAP